MGNNPNINSLPFMGVPAPLWMFNALRSGEIDTEEFVLILCIDAAPQANDAEYAWMIGNKEPTIKRSIDRLLKDGIIFVTVSPANPRSLWVKKSTCQGSI